MYRVITLYSVQRNQFATQLALSSYKRPVSRPAQSPASHQSIPHPRTTMAARPGSRRLVASLVAPAARRGLRDGPRQAPSRRAAPGPERPGHNARTDADVAMAYPADHELPPSKPVGGLPGQYVRPTLASFSLDGNVGLVTDGARGLGLVMAQGMVTSGADVALVDMNS